MKDMIYVFTRTYSMAKHLMRNFSPLDWRWVSDGHVLRGLGNVRVVLDSPRGPYLLSESEMRRLDRIYLALHALEATTGVRYGKIVDGAFVEVMR